jgi:hypothetical protein
MRLLVMWYSHLEPHTKLCIVLAYSIVTLLAAFAPPYLPMPFGKTLCWVLYSCLAILVLFIILEVAKPLALRVFGLLLGVLAFILLPFLLRSFAPSASTQTAAVSSYPAALLDCVEDVRIGQRRTYRRSYLPTNIVYMTERTYYQVSADDVPTYAADGALLQLSGEFVLCSLTNEGGRELTEIALTFQSLFVAADLGVAPGGREAFLVNQNARRVPVKVYTLTIAPHSKFEFALVNFGVTDCVLGIPLNFGGPPTLPDLSYRIGSQGRDTGDRPLTTTKDTETALSISLPPSKRKATPWVVVDKCSRAILHSDDPKDFSEEHEELNRLPQECKRMPRSEAPMLGAPK